MATANLTAEQQNEQNSRQELVNALEDIRKHANEALREMDSLREQIETVLGVVPAGVTLEDLDLEEIGGALGATAGFDLDSRDVNPVGRSIDKMRRYLEEANGQHEYLTAGDFSE